MSHKATTDSTKAQSLHRRVVYCDDSYPSAWIPVPSIEVISEFLVKKGFERKNALELRKWMKAVIEAKTASSTVVVMAQDVIPDTVAKEASSNVLIRRYLDKGGRVVWIGDIPFYYQGKARGTVVDLSSGRDPRLNEWNLGGMYGILGAVSASIVSKGPCSITKQGQDRGLQTPWVSSRPISKRWLRRGEVLATANLLPGVTIEDIAPQRVVTQPSSTTESVIAAKDLVEAIKTLVEVIILAGATLLTLLGPIPDYVGDIPVRLPLTAVILGGGLTLIAYFWHKSKKRGSFSSGWVMKFNNQGEFIRVWDLFDPPFDSERLRELLTISTSSRT